MTGQLKLYIEIKEEYRFEKKVSIVIFDGVAVKTTNMKHR